MDVTITLTGTEPLLMHSARLADPLDPATKALKAVTSKRIKTDADHEEVARLEWLGGFYLDADVGPYVPGENIERCLFDAAKITRSGQKVKQGLFITSNTNPLAYTGPRDVNGLWPDANFRFVSTVKVTTSRVVRTRPRFRDWSVQADILLDENILSLRDLQDIAATAGTRIGLGDYRPRFGRFTALVETA